jgi:hypothetical protein
MFVYEKLIILNDLNLNFVKNTYTKAIYKKCFDRFQVNELYETINVRVFSGQIYKLTN